MAKTVYISSCRGKRRDTKKNAVGIAEKFLELEKENAELKIQISSLRNHISQLLEEKEEEAL